MGGARRLLGRVVATVAGQPPARARRARGLATAGGRGAASRSWPECSTAQAPDGDPGAERRAVPSPMTDTGGVGPRSSTRWATAAVDGRTTDLDRRRAGCAWDRRRAGARRRHGLRREQRRLQPGAGTCCRRSSSPSATSCSRPSPRGGHCRGGRPRGAAFMFFVTFDENGLPPYNTEGILIVSTGVWLGTYVIGPGKAPVLPGLRGSSGSGSRCWSSPRTSSTTPSTRSSFGVAPGRGHRTIDPRPARSSTAGLRLDGGFDRRPRPATIGMLSLAFGIGFPARGRGSTAGRHGTATPFAFAALPCLASV